MSDPRLERLLELTADIGRRSPAEMSEAIVLGRALEAEYGAGRVEGGVPSGEPFSLQPDPPADGDTLF